MVKRRSIVKSQWKLSPAETFPHSPDLLSFRQTTTLVPIRVSPIEMPICIECRYPVSNLYTTYSKADDKALGKGVRLTQCPRCKRFADKYVEHDFVVLFIDLVLIKPQVRARCEKLFDCLLSECLGVASWIC